MAPDTGQADVVIVGGGYSGTMLAAELARRGYRVVRFWNGDVMNNLAGVLDVIRMELDGN